MYRRTGNLTQSYSMLEKELKGREHTKGVDHPETLHVVSSSLLPSLLPFFCLLLLACFPRSIAYIFSPRYSPLQKIYSSFPSPLIHTTQSCQLTLCSSFLVQVNNLAVVLKEQGHLVEAKGWYERALQGLTLALGPDHATTLDTVYNLANLLHAQVGSNRVYLLLP